ncbi:MAG: helix-turn-helix domain-containing protein [Lachnospiraceae bacterium]|nr:helix-turn-helix domain-containing protein [Lachnospiraceae bacterium]
MSTINELAVNLSPDATMGDKVRALRAAQKMSMAELSRRSGLTTRAIRYYEDNERVPSVDAVKKLSAAFDVSTSFFLDDDEFRRQEKQDAFLEQVNKEYGSRGKAQARRLLEDTNALFAGGELSEEEQGDFIDEMQELFVIAKKRAKAKRGSSKNAQNSQ